MDIVEFAQQYLDIELRPHQIEWLDFIIENPASLLLAPRGHGKSTIMYCFLVWAVCMDPGIRILIAAHKEELANTFARMVQRALERKDIQEDFGLRPGKPWRVDYFFFKEKRHPVVQTVAKQAGMTGGRYDIVVFDDLLTVENSRTEKRRMQLEEWINSEVIPALDPSPKRKEIVVGTRKNVEDWYSKILEMPDFKHMVYRLYDVIDEEKRYLWPERYDEAEEARLRARMEPDQFAREFMNEPISSQGIRFKMEWVKPHFYTSWQNDVPERHRQIYMGIDPSLGSKNDRASYMGLVVVCFDKRPDRQNIYVVDMVRSKLSLVEQADIIRQKVEEWEPVGVRMEDVLVNKVFAAQMRRELPIITTVDYIHSKLGGTTDVSKIGRIENIAGWLFKHGKIRLKDPKISAMTKLFLEHEYLQFPEGEMDLLDALNMAVDMIDTRKRIKSPGLFFR